MKTACLLASGLILCGAGDAAPQERFAGSENLDAVIDQAITGDQVPGAVLIVGHKGKILHRQAYGARSLVPVREAMTLDTIFDIASLTKVIATAPAVMQLFEKGRLRLNDRVTEYLPEFQGGDSGITARYLLTHFSGLRPDVDLEPPWKGYDTGVKLALADDPVAQPGERFIYSDINYILLAEIVHRVTGKLLSDYARENIFEPLGMKDTMFLPPPELQGRIAPTERIPGSREPLRGLVHDPTTRFMGGVSGHAGVFSTADDLAVFAEMMLGLGEYRGTRILSTATVRKMTSPQSPADQPILRGIGWDIDSPYSGNRGELFPLGSYGHTGFTGTSLWIDPVTKTYIILLANSVHPNQRASISSLRARVATVTAAALDFDLPGVSLTGYNETLAGAGARRRVARNGKVLTGLDILAARQFAELKGKRVGLITNHTGLSREGKRNIDLMVETGVNVTALFSPEHGMTGGQESASVEHAKDSATGVNIWSLYTADGRRPTANMLEDVDVLVFDIQDVGARFYTYMCTMLYAMEEAAKRRITFMVLDRPNPITGVHVEGPMLDEDLQSFVGCYPLPLRHGMTLGEIAMMMNTERRIGADLRVIQMKGWQRGDWFDSTNLVWINPSPNIRSLNAALLYPGIAMLEASDNYSVGRGTGSPFEQIGADWINGSELAGYMNSQKIPGIRFYPTRFLPSSSRFSGILIEGVRLVITDREVVNSSRLGLELAAGLRFLYPGRIQWKINEGLIGSHDTLAALDSGEDPELIQESQQEQLHAFLGRREKFLLYR